MNTGPPEHRERKEERGAGAPFSEPIWVRKEPPVEISDGKLAWLEMDTEALGANIAVMKSGDAEFMDTVWVLELGAPRALRLYQCHAPIAAEAWPERSR